MEENNLKPILQPPDNKQVTSELSNFRKANLGFFEAEGLKKNADNVFVLVVHYPFEAGNDVYPQRLGDDKDVENLRKTFQAKRKCEFYQLQSPRKDFLLEMLKSEDEIKRCFKSEDMEPSVFFLYILSHGFKGGVIFTDTLLQNEPVTYENFTTNEVFESVVNTFPNCLKFLILGPCRGQLRDSVHGNVDDAQLVYNQDSCKITYEPNIRNLVILYATVETTTARRDDLTGTWIVRYFCEELNQMKESKSVLHFLTSVQHRIHERSTTFSNDGQTPELKVFPADTSFAFAPLDMSDIENEENLSEGKDAVGHLPSEEEILYLLKKDKNIDFSWRNPMSEAIIRRRRAIIFYQGNAEMDEIENLDLAITRNLGFETIRVKISTDSLSHYFKQSEEDLWHKYGCFMAFIFAEISDQDDGKICIKVNGAIQKPAGEIIHGLLGPNNKDWIGKPKLFFFIDTENTDHDSVSIGKASPLTELTNLAKIRATNHSSWLAFILRKKDDNVRRELFKIFACSKLRNDESLQELLGKFFCSVNLRRNENQQETIGAILVSTLPHLLKFPDLERNFVKPHFTGKFGSVNIDTIDYHELLVRATLMNTYNLWLLSSLPGSGKSTVMREIAYELQSRFIGVMNVFFVALIDIYKFVSSKKKCPSISAVLAHATGNHEVDIINMIFKRKLIVFFDGFDEMCPKQRKKMLEIFVKAVNKEVPMWISTRPHEESEIRRKFLGKSVKTYVNVKVIQILPLDKFKQIEMMRKISNRDEKDSLQQIEVFEKAGHSDILGNPLHLKLIAEILDSSNLQNGLNLFEIYQTIIYTKVREVMKKTHKEDEAHFDENVNEHVDELKDLADKYLKKTVLVDANYENFKNTFTGIVTFRGGQFRFVHQTFAEFLAAKSYIDCWENENLVSFDDIFCDGYRQVRMFINMYFASESGENLLPTFSKLLSRSRSIYIALNIIIVENLFAIFSLVKNQIKFDKKFKNVKGKMYFRCSDELFEKALNGKEILMQLFEIGALKKLKDCEIAVKIFTSKLKEKNVEFLRKMTQWSEDSDMNLLQHVVRSCQLRELIKNVAVTSAFENHHAMLSFILDMALLDDNVAKSEALEVAIKNNSATCAEYLIRFGACIETHHLTNIPPLNLDTVEALWPATINNSITKEMQKLIFEVALEDGNIDVLKFLVGRNQNLLHQTRESGKNDLHFVAGSKSNASNLAAVCRWLIEEVGINADSIDFEGRNALHYAAEAGNLPVIKTVLEIAPELLHSVTFNSENALHFISAKPCPLSYIEDESVKIATFLHDRDASLIRQVALTNETALHMAANAANVKMCKWLVRNRVDLLAENDNGWNAFHCLMTRSSDAAVQIADFLLRKEPSFLQVMTRDGRTVLHLAVGEAHYEMCRLLLTFEELQVDARDNNGWNALHYAAAMSNAKIADLLHKKNSGLLDQKTNRDETVLHIATKYKNKEVFHWLVNDQQVDTLVQDVDGKIAADYYETNESNSYSFDSDIDMDDDDDDFGLGFRWRTYEEDSSSYITLSTNRENSCIFSVFQSCFSVCRK
ncbi:uncharacterized protein LOC132196463 [Neocloeon triangulifer]|uniref:uncharacterized protein LOC132196463 n=1 Tax=Neocloeon triangulifer TaxID=2078957 RepID=UPI00286F5605|nr:uncharacterized protein LOC132196463 [Neocloeon triangulifer]XP_059475120.1 uncharacterized protein LOC132196463 [Neocloeon triangulifer]XP_059475121.1 uncharacterized protein LOC132196463 [Neocloeon triangulifer]